jgi:hypothetical protein
MTIKEFIQNQVFIPRLNNNGILVVYDPERRYRELCLELTSDVLRVVDASESSIESREEANTLLCNLGQPDTNQEGLLVYVPARSSLTDEDKQRDPFAIYTVCGNIFPESDGDEYMNICLKAKPDHATEIRRIFTDNPNPDFSVIDAVSGGIGWPTLQSLLKVESARNIIFALLAPSDNQMQALKNQDAWVNEAKELLKTSLGLKLKTRAKAWSSISDELWRFLLFSEFVLDMPGELPEALVNVPCAEQEAKLLIEDLCDLLRNDQRTQSLYIEKADTIEEDLNLKIICEQINELGERDTFSFEERVFLKQSIDAIKQEDSDRAQNIIQRHAHTVWAGKGEIQAQWDLVQAALNLIQACDDCDMQLGDYSRSQEMLIEFYLGSMRESDRLQREFEQIASYSVEEDFLEDIIYKAQGRYRRLVENVQTLFIKHLESSGWPPNNRLSNADVFDHLVAPKLQESGRRVAYFHVDALRYELGVALHNQLSDEFRVELKAAFAQLPTVTSVGMASLLPEAGKNLKIEIVDDNLIPIIDKIQIKSVSQRMNVFRKKYGQRFDEMTLNDFIKSKQKISDTVELLVIRTTTIDAQMESNPELALSFMYDNLKRIRRSIHKLSDLGFHDAVIATDHGFFLNTQAEAGDVCVKPQGAWYNAHERSLLGDGSHDSNNFVIPVEKLGIRSDVAKLAGPRSIVPYRGGMPYYHGGVSLQEAIVPVLLVNLKTEKKHEISKILVILNYKNGKKSINTRMPVIDLNVTSGSLFSTGKDFEILLEAHDKKGNIVGEVKSGTAVNPATGTLVMQPGQQEQIILKMQEEYEGKFTIKALNPVTLELYCKLDLKTDYTV